MSAARAAIAATALVLTTAPAIADPGTEKDTRRCVTLREPWSTPSELTRPELERRWDVRGKGYRVKDPFTGLPEWIYPLCDREFPASYAAAMFRNGTVWAVATFESGEDPRR